MVSDPGGNLNTCLGALRFAAFHGFKNVGFHPYSEIYPVTTNIHISGLNTEPASSFPPGFGPPLLVLPSGFTAELVANLCSGGTCYHIPPSISHPLGNNDLFLKSIFNPKVSDLPWHDDADVSDF